MTLFFDIGNGQIKWQQSDSFVSPPPAFLYHRRGLSEQLDHHLGRCPVPDDVVIVSVAGERIDAQIESWIKSNWGAGVVFLHSQQCWQMLQNGYDDPDTLGDDRWYALVGAVSRYACPLIVADIGSAVTIDIVDSRGQHLGGYITPGIEMMRQALNRGTDIDLSGSQSLIEATSVPNNTVSAVNQGALLATAAFIDSVHAASESKSISILTGGGDTQMADLMHSSVTVDSNLMFFGIKSVIDEC